MCGACIEGTGTGGGSGATPIGTFKAYVSDKCPECASGSLDFALTGDGRWDIEWSFVPCPGSDVPTFMFEGSNLFYWKIQPRGTASPVEELTVNGLPGMRTDDNFFVIEDGGPFEGPQEVTTTTIDGVTVTTMVSLP